MNKRVSTFIIGALLISQLPACTTRAWYGTMQSLAKQNCQHRPPAEQLDCEARRYKEDFETYDKQRKVPILSKERTELP